MHRAHLLLTVASVACRAEPTASTSEASGTADVTTVATTTNTGTTDATTATTITGNPTTEIPTTTAPDPPPPIRGEWLGTYTTGFGFVSFQPCNEPDVWALLDDSLPYFNECTQAPLWLRLQGTATVDGNSAYLAVTAILTGPCALGSCDGTTPLDGCASFDELCAP